MIEGNVEVNAHAFIEYVQSKTELVELLSDPDMLEALSEYPALRAKILNVLTILSEKAAALMVSMNVDDFHNALDKWRDDNQV